MATNDDTMMEQLAAAQNATGEAIQGIIRNFKKDSALRKTSQYYEERIRRLDAAWAEFEIIDNKIRCLEAPPLNHKYFTEDYYTKISDLTNNYRELFEKAMMETPKESASNIGQQITNDDPKAPARPDPTNTTTTPSNSRIRRQNVMMASLQRLFTTDPEATNLQQKKKLWAQIEELHFSIWESSTDPPKEGYDMKTYLNLEQLIAENFRAISQDSEKGVNFMQPNVLPLPKITLPTFCGDYLKWRGFSDLFSQLVDSQQLPTAQKMWYLKSNLGGEAEKLISHLSATADNYSAAWNLLQARYNNQRIIVSTIMQQLLDQPNTGSSAAAIKLLHDTTQECIHALNNIGIDTTSWDPMLLHLLIKKLDRGTLILYERTISNPKELQNLQDFLKFLETHFQSLEFTTQKEKSPRVCVSATSANKSESPCPLCKTGHHPLHQCQKFQQLSPQSRLSFVQNQNQCVNCLKSGHTARVCRSRPCKICKKLHHSLLHLNNKQSTNQGSSNRGTSQMTTSTTTTAPATTKPNVHEAPTTTPEVSSLTAASGHTFNSYVLLSTAVVKIKTETQEVECRALLDAGSQVNFITERLAKRLNIAKQPSSTNIKGIGNCNTKTRHRVNVSLHSRINGFSTRLEALVLPQIVAPQPSQFVNIDDWPLPKNLTLADPAFNKPDRIDILLGAEHCLQLLAIGQIKLSPHLPTLQNTVLGWILGGKLDEEHSTEALCGICTEDEGLEASIARLWELDEVKPTTRPLSIADKQCEEHFAQHTTRNNQNHFVVRIPFHQNPNLLGDSHGIALNRFFALERRLQRSPELKAKYIEFMDEYESMGHMTKWEPKSSISPTYYIPHHCVLRPESSTTKLRVVFDASAKTSSGYSLNDLMFTGPTLQSELFSILLRFRMPRFVFTTDVAKMYRQVLVAPEDRQLQLIIWRKDTTRPITYYQLNTVTYGTRSAPYLATKCLTQLAKENETRYPLASKFLQENFYVDDGLGGFDSLITALDVQQQLVQILKEGGFTLRKWCANHPKLLHNIPQGHVEVDLDFESTKVDSIKTLGLIWLPKDDKLGIRVNIESIKKITKRTATSDLARVFDPLGLLSPVTVTAKIFIQELWALKLDWDQSLPEHMHTKWMNFRTDLNELKTLQLSRHIFNGGIPTSVQLHIFTDASEKAYGAAAYLRSTTTNGSIITRLLCAKSRVAPLKTQTIPRLELCAAALGAQLAAKITTDLQLSSQVWFWTDSEIVLAWINSPAALNTFVANRVSTILQTTQASQWRHVSSKINPADILSRGISPRHLKDCSLWFFGPLFLHGQDAAWPPKYNPTHAMPTDLERKVKQTLTVTSTEPDFIYKINHGNSFWRLQNIVGYVLRFITQIKGKGDLRRSQNSLTTTELDNALKLIIKQIQASDFKQEIHQLAKYKELRGTSNLSNLSPFLDTDGLIRVGGRLEASPLQYDSKHQFLIPYNDPIAKLIFEMVHKDNKHCGAQTLLGIVRHKFWPIKGKIMSRATVHRCTICSRAKPALFHQIMGNLPSTRVTPARAFINAGVDYCGPITVHYKLRGKRPHKAYYRQVLVAPEDRQLQLIIWRKDTTRPITYYQLNTVTYGTRSAPYLATKCLTQLAKENETRYPLASKFLQENFYVDDGLGGFDSLITALDVQQQLVQILKEGGFTLRKWCANHPKLLHNIPQGHVEVDLDFESTKVDSIKTLGLIWLPKDDKLGIRVNIESIKKITKRTATSDLARVFDPLGLLSPVTVTAKIFIQELWALKLDWDQSLPEHMHTKWMNFRTDLNELKTLQLSRHIFNGGIPTSVQLHIFTDASEKAYGAAAYLRSTTTNGSIITRLLCAKSRVAPLKTQTIPRLELCAAALGAQLAAKITTDLQLSSQVWFWTDSEIVLAWINSPAALNTFVANRVSTILQTTQASQWRHVSSKINPADILSRGISPRHLKDCSLWFFGPLFLHGQDAAWPPKYNPTHAMPTDLERKVKQTLTVTSTEPDFIYKINHGNSFWRLQNIVGYVLRFITQIKGKGDLRRSQNSLTTTELDNALKLIIKQIQASDFKQEIHQLAKYKELRGTSNLSNLSPFLDTDGLIRVGGRLEASPLQYDSKHQFLIPYNDPIAKLIFEMVHKDNKHCGAQTLLGIVRHKFWPIKGKIMSRATVHRCTICSRAKPALFHQIMGNLPSTRVTPARAFINAGVDYCGPITVHYKLRGKRPHKAYIAVFCCFATKAVHLELVSDLTTEAFIGALKRFISRRGHCQNLYCDNATNFVGAKNKLPELSTVIHSSDAQATILNACSKKGIQFNFIPPRAPHFGGLWEAAVKSAKYLLVRTLGNASLTYEELETVIVEIEAILNSRPISPMSNDANDIGALTPGHFLIGEPLTAQIDAQAKPTPLKLETRWKLVSHLKHEFWKRWSRDYLNELLSEPQSSRASADERPPTKKQRTLASSILTTLLTVLLLLPLVSTDKVKIIQFEPNLGLYFEGISNTKVSRSEWNIISYYNLNPYWKEVSRLMIEATELHRLCEHLTQNTTCPSLLQAIDLSIAGLKDKNLLLKRRLKRGAINVVGNVANSLFGVLDSNYAAPLPNKLHCTLKLDSITIQGHQTVSTSLQTSYTAISNISEIIYPDEVQGKIIHFKTYGDQIKNISELQGKLHKMVSSEFPSQIKTIQYHHGIIAYVALGLTIMICITMAWKRIHCKRSEPNHQPPTPASRQHISTAEFEVSVT